MLSECLVKYITQRARSSLTASSYTVGPQAYHVTFFPSESNGTNGFLLLVKLLYMDSCGSRAATGSAGAGGGVHSGCTAAIFDDARRNEAVDVAEGFMCLNVNRQAHRKNPVIKRLALQSLHCCHARQRIQN